MAGTSGTHRVFVDPARVNLRKAARAAVVVPSLFAFLVVSGNTPSALFGAFGSFSALVFAELGGALPRRRRAYGGLVVIGGLLGALGTAFADTIWPVAVATLVVAFAITLCDALGGYQAAGGTTATLAFVLAVMSPGVQADLAARELGWVLGVGVAGFAAVLPWPVHQRDRVTGGRGDRAARGGDRAGDAPSDRRLDDARRGGGAHRVRGRGLPARGQHHARARAGLTGHHRAAPRPDARRSDRG